MKLRGNLCRCLSLLSKEANKGRLLVRKLSRLFLVKAASMHAKVLNRLVVRMVRYSLIAIPQEKRETLQMYFHAREHQGLRQRARIRDSLWTYA